MRLSARLEFDVLALNTPDSVLLLVEVTAPERAEEGDRSPATPQVVPDRSGSMARDRHAPGAIGALHGVSADEAEYPPAKTASVMVRSGEHVERLSVVGESPPTRIDDGALMVELGDFFAGESRRLLLRVSTAPLAEADTRSGDGPVSLAEVELTHVDPGTSETRTSRLELTVETAWDVSGRVSRPEVRAENLFQRAQAAKRLAADEMRRGRRGEASRHLRNSREEMSPALGSEEFGALRPETGSQVEVLEQMAAQAEKGDVQRAAKAIHASRAGSVRGRGPQGRPGGRLQGGQNHSGQSFPDSPSSPPTSEDR